MRRRMILGLVLGMTLAMANGSFAVGTGTVDRSTGWYPAGTNVTVTATAGANSEFTSWGGDTNTATVIGVTQLQFTVNSPMTIDATFSHILWDVVASVGAGSGTISPPGTTSVPQSSNQLYTFSPGAFSHVDDVLIDGSSIGATNSYTFTNVTNARTIEVRFALDQYTVEYLADANGTISGLATQLITHGSNTVAVTPVPNTGYHFVDWSDSLTGNPRTDNNVTSNMSLTANFAIDTYTFTVASEWGSANPAGVTTCDWNTVVDAYMPTAEIVSGNSMTQYVATGWIGTGSLADGSGTNASFTITNTTTLTWQWQTNFWVDFTITGN